MNLAHDPNAGAPDWSTLDFEVTCPRCAYNLKMLAQPRCPECGLKYEWPAVVEAAREARRDCPLFEYRWATRPVRSFLHTFFLCQIPSRLWKSVRLTHAPRPGALIAWAMLALLLMTAFEWGRSTLEFKWLNSYGAGPPMPWIVLQAASGVAVVDELKARTILLPMFVVFVAVYRVTFVRYRIVWGHLLRIGIYAWAAYGGWALIVNLVVTGMMLINQHLAGTAGMGMTGFAPVPNQDLLDRIAVSVNWIPPLATLWSLVAAFGTYLQLPRAWLAAISSFVMITVAYLVFCTTMAVQIESRLSVSAWMRTLDVWTPGLRLAVEAVLARSMAL